MSLNKTLERLFDEIRREAKRNPDFANRMDAVLRLHASRREVSDDVVEEVSSPVRADGGGGAVGAAGRDDVAADAPPAPPARASTPAAGKSVAPEARALNPVAMFRRDGAEALLAVLVTQDLAALRAVVAEHNLDPGEITSALTRDELAAHVVAQALRRAERDEKMFDY
jgi:hypothetical protein